MGRSYRLSMLPFLLLSTAGCPGEAAVERPTDIAVAGAPGGGFRDVVQQVLPSIVFIQTEATPPPGIERFLPGVQQLPAHPIPVGMGSGVIFTADGYILTNNHVVQTAERVRVVLADRRHFEAEVVGRDPSTDVAVVRIVGEGFAAAPLGDSDQVHIGDWVLALGSPLGLQFSVTAGVVSGVGRAIGILGTQPRSPGEQAAPLEHFIQTDAALSPGNSGGPLINSAGQVIGINTAVAAPPGVPGSVGFAIPSNLARITAEQLIQFGEVRRAFLGVSLANVTPMMAAAEGLERVEGAVIMQVDPAGPAAAAGLQPGDVILEVGGQPILTVSDLQNQLVRLEPGSTVPLRAIRAGREITVSAELGLVTGGIRPTL
jgi:serine protease Do